MYRVILCLGNGSLEKGFTSVSVQLIDPLGIQQLKQEGMLPANPQLIALYQSWKQLYQAYYLQRSRIPSRLEFVPESDPLYASSEGEFQDCCDHLTVTFEKWLASPGFIQLSNIVRSRVHPEQPCQWMIESNDPIIQNLPWHLWSFFQDYPLAEFAISLPNFERILPLHHSVSDELKILFILGSPTDASGQQVDLQTDQKIIESIPWVSTVVVSQISLAELADLLWEHSWDIILFSGHSTGAGSEEQAGFLLTSESSKNFMTVSALRSAFKAAIQKRLKLVIFNSCNSFELGLDLLRLNLPMCIAMGEVVPDRVAQRFLRYLVQQWDEHDSLLLAVRNARERLKESEESTLPCASWLPVICQNPTAPLPSWPAKIRHKTYQYRQCRSSTFRAFRGLKPRTRSMICGLGAMVFLLGVQMLDRTTSLVSMSLSHNNSPHQNNQTIHFSPFNPFACLLHPLHLHKRGAVVETKDVTHMHSIQTHRVWQPKVLALSNEQTNNLKSRTIKAYWCGKLCVVHQRTACLLKSPSRYRSLDHQAHGLKSGKNE